MVDIMASPVRYWPTTTGELEGVALAPCPYCGELWNFEGLEALVDEGDGLELSAIGCCGCGASGPLEEGGVSGAVAGWNRRAGAPQ